jgi:2-methylaconitate cis-trans-isomerase PrpF
LAAATRIRGSVAAGVAASGDGGSVGVEHPAGTLTIQCEGEGEDITTSVIRTARLLFAGFVYVPVEVMVEGQG